jgi:hypothetical protein
MSAYAIHMKLSCDTRGCKRRVAQLVFNTFNEMLGQFCKRCSEKRVSELNKTEAAVVRSVIAERNR